MKRNILCLMIGAFLAFGLCACGEKADNVTEVSQTESVAEVSEAEETVEEVTHPKLDTTPPAQTNNNSGFSLADRATANMSEEEIYVMTGDYTDAMDFVSNITVGWNLGNTFDATNGGSMGLGYETYWQGAKTTKELITAVKKAGFNTIRIPVSWHDHVDANNQIDEAWMNRVQEVVDYCIDQDLYVILNTHHDITKKAMYPTLALEEQSTKFLTDVWSQIAEHFKGYDEKLIFESLNEIRLVDTNYEWTLGSSQECKDAVAIINRLNQTFVETVRSSGGNNAGRYLLIPGYATSTDGITNSGFRMPTDDANETPHLILVVHSYAPYGFALNTSGTDKWSADNSSDTNDIDSLMTKLYSNFVKKGIPVIIDEFGCLDKNNTEARAANAKYFVEQAHYYKIPCVWWDNHNMTNSGEKFALFNRKTNEVLYPSIVEGIMEGLKGEVIAE